MAKRKARRSAFGTVFQRGSVFVAQWIDPQTKKRRKRPCGTTRETADLFLATLKNKIDRGEHLGLRDVEPATLAQVWAAVEPERRLKLRPQSFRAFAGRIGMAAKFYGSKPVHEVDAPAVRDYLASLRQPDRSENAKEGATVPVSGATRNRHRMTLSWVLAQAVERGNAKANPVPSVKSEREPVRDRPYLPPSDVALLIAGLKPKFRDFLTLAFDSGLRRGELCALEWRDVDWSAGERGALVVRTSKSKRSRRVPLTMRAHALLKRLERERRPGPRAEFVFPAFKDHNLVTRAVSRAAAKLGERFEDVTLHTARHTFCSGLARAGVPLTDIMRLAGHSSLAVTQRYACHAPADATFTAMAAFERAQAASD